MNTPPKQVGPPHKVGTYLLRVIDDDPAIWVEAKRVKVGAIARPARITFGPDGLIIWDPTPKEISHELLASILKACGWKVQAPDG